MVYFIPLSPDQIDSLIDEFFRPGEFANRHSLGKIQCHRIDPELRSCTPFPCAVAVLILPASARESNRMVAASVGDTETRWQVGGQPHNPSGEL